MDFPVFLNKWIIGFSPIKYTSFWWWYRLISHQGFRFDDYHVWGEFWHSLNHGWEHMEYVYKFEEFWGKGSYPPEKIIVSKEAYDTLIEAINKPPDHEKVERLREIMNKPGPWDELWNEENE